MRLRSGGYRYTGKWPEDGSNVDRNEGAPEDIAVPEAEDDEGDDDDRDDTKKPPGGKKSRQKPKDACERNGIESSNGVAKRRYGLDLIMSKLDETS